MVVYWLSFQNDGLLVFGIMVLHASSYLIFFYVVKLLATNNVTHSQSRLFLLNIVFTKFHV